MVRDDAMVVGVWMGASDVRVEALLGEVIISRLAEYR